MSHLLPPPDAQKLACQVVHVTSDLLGANTHHQAHAVETTRYYMLVPVLQNTELQEGWRGACQAQLGPESELTLVSCSWQQRWRQLKWGGRGMSPLMGTE